MEIIIELVVYVVLELLLGLVSEALVGLGFHALELKSPTRASNRFFAFALYAIGGIVLGAISLMFMRSTAVEGWIFALYLIIAPIIGGLGLCLFHWIINRGIDERPFFRLNKFLNGATFVLAFSLTRAFFG